jgi:hypothetical protein
MEALCTDGVGDPEDVAHQKNHSILVDVRRTSTGRVATLIRGNHAVTRLRERNELRAPFVRGFGKSMEQDHGLTVGRAGDARVEHHCPYG